MSTPPRPRARFVLPLVLFLALAAAPAAAQDGAILLTGPEEPVFLHGGDSGTIEFTLRSLDGSQSQHVTVSVAVPSEANWEVEVVPASTVLAPGDQRTVTVHITAAPHPAPRVLEMEVQVTAVAEDFTTAIAVAAGSAQATGTDYILGRWENPLPAPLDNAIGSFLLNFGAWLLIGLATMWLISPTLKLLTLRTKTDLDDRIIKIISRPAFVLVFTFGIVRSLQVFPLPAWVFSTLESTWRVVLAIAVVYVAYRLWNAVILALGRRMTSKTESDLDDKLYPVFEKVGGVIILIVGLFYILGSFGVDLTLFAAGGAIGGLVIAFAAQDTLANFFAGVFILLDRPFRVGDRIELPEQNHWGDVQKIGLRTTAVKTQDNRMVIFPNNYIGSNPVINHSYPDPLYRIQIDFKLPYGSDVEFVRKTLVEAVKPVEGVNADRAPEALLLEFTEHGQGWRLRWWINSYTDTRRAYDRVNSAVIKEMAKHGIRIQYLPLTVWDAHKLLDRDSKGGLSPVSLSDAEREELEREAEELRQRAEQAEKDEIEEVKRVARKEAADKRKEREKDAGADEAEAEAAAQEAADAKTSDPEADR